MDQTLIDILKWGGAAAGIVYFVLRELKERRALENIITGYERLAGEQQRVLGKTTEALTQLIERLEPGSVLTEHISLSTQTLTKLCDRIDAWDRRVMRCEEREKP